MDERRGGEVPSPSPAGDHFVQSMGGWSCGGFLDMERFCGVWLEIERDDDERKCLIDIEGGSC